MSTKMKDRVIRAEEPDTYTGCKNGKYTKKKANVYACNLEEGLEDKTKIAVGYVKAEPVINPKGEVISEIWYYRGAYRNREMPNYFGSLRMLVEFIQTQFNEAHVVPEYKKSENFVSLDTEE